MTRALISLLIALLLSASLATAQLFEDGSGRLLGQSFCIPFALCSEE